MSEIAVLTEYQRAKLAREHAMGCATCLTVAVRYRSEIADAAKAGSLPDALASKIRAQLCGVGAKILDRVLGVPS